MKKRYTGKEGYPPSRVNLSGGLYEKKTLTPLLELVARAHALIVYSKSRTCFGCLALIELTGRREPKCLYGEKLTGLCP